MAQVAEAALKSEKKTRDRSPNYPAVGLREAVERVKKLIEKDGKAGASPNLVAMHIGFASAHGAAMSIVAALKKFGLLEPSGDRLVPTQRALEIYNLPENDPRRVQALKDAALSPPIYRELIEQHRNSGFPANDTLQSELATYKGFNRNAVADFVKDFKDTLDFAGLSEISELNSQLMSTTQKQEGHSPQEFDHKVIQDVFGSIFSPSKSPQGVPQTVVRRYPMDISIPRNMKAELSISGGELRKEDLERLKKQLDRLIDNLSDAFED